MTIGSSQHQCCLMKLVEGGCWRFMTKIEEYTADFSVAERGSKVERRVGLAVRGYIWVMEETRV